MSMKSYVRPVLLRKLSWRPAPFASMAGTVRLLVLNGKGLDTRGSTEESRTYFRSSAQLSDYDAHIRATAAELGVAVEHLQTNDLNECIRLLSGTDAHAIVINPAGILACRTSNRLDLLGAGGWFVCAILYYILYIILYGCASMYFYHG
ncbi:aroQ [Symbiodinium sp. CCMP2592]|nr:aroQ [Symbiodinium sp. CCMP2592]